MTGDRVQTIIRTGTLLALAAFAVCAPPAAAAPALRWIYPSGGRIGTTVEVQVHGADLARLAGLWLPGPGLTAELLPPTGKLRGSAAGEERIARITIAPTAAIGDYVLRVYNSTGLSTPKIFRVDPWPEVMAVEPNSTPEEAQRITIPATVNSQLGSASDRDCFRFTARSGEEIVCDMRAERLLSDVGDSWIRGFMEVLDDHGVVLARDTGHYGWDPFIAFTAPRDGDYIIRVRDLLYRGAVSAVYRLTIGAIPHSDAVFPAGGQHGQTIRLAFYGANLGPAPTLSWNPPAGGGGDTTEVSLPTAAGDSNPLTVLPSPDPAISEIEPNDDAATATPVTLPATINGRIDHPGDHDFYRVHGVAHERIIFELFSDRLGSPMDSILNLRNAGGKLVAQNDDAHGRDSLIDYTFPADGDYTLEVADVNGGGGSNYVYCISAAPPRPGFRLTVQPDIIDVPPEGAAVLHVQVHRWWGFDGPVQISVRGLPPGVRATLVPEAAAGAATVGVILQAAPIGPVVPADDPFAQLALRINGAPAQRPSQIEVSGVAAVAGQPVRQIAAAVQTYRMENTPHERTLVGPVAMLSSEAPLVLRTGTGAVSLEPGGAAALEVQITRSVGLDGPVRLTVENLPTGVSADPVTIPQGESRATVTFKAKPKTAAVRTSLSVSGLLRLLDGSDLETALPPIHLEVLGPIKSTDDRAPADRSNPTPAVTPKPAPAV